MPSKPIRVAIVGAGYMGTAHARVLKRIASEQPGLLELSYIVDIDSEKARIASWRYGGKPLERTRDIPEGAVDLAVVATPTEKHSETVEELAARGVKAIIVEKPMAPSISEAYRILELGREYGLWIGAGHIERFNPVVRALHSRLKRGYFGEVLTLTARRVGPYSPRVSGTDVVYDLAVHEVDNTLVVYGQLPATVKSYTLRGLVSGLTDYVLAVLGYGHGYASIEANRLTPFKQRILYITTGKGVVYLDYMNQVLVFYREDEEVRIRVQHEEPLYLEDKAFTESLARGSRPPIDALQAFTVLYVCQKILDSTRLSRELVLEEQDDYTAYSDILAEGVRGVERFLEHYT